MMRILLTVPSLDPAFGGPTAMVGPMASALRDAGHDVRIVGADDAAGAIGLGRAFVFHETPVPSRARPIARLVRAADVVHIIGYRDPVSTLAAWTARRHGIPYVLEPVGTHRRRLRSTDLKRAYDLGPGRIVVGGAACLVATSRLEADELAADGVSPVRIRVRPIGVDVSHLLPLPARGAFRESLGIPMAVPLVLSLGRITAKKGLLDLARAIGMVPDAWCAVVGPDARDGTLQRLERAVEAPALAGRVRIRPAGVWGLEKAQAMADADVFALPSETENFGMAAAEAACVGLPLALSDQTGAAEWLDPSSMRVVPFGVPEHLAAAISDLADSSSGAAAERAAPRLRRTLSWSAVIRQQIDIYEAITSGDR